MIKNDLKMSYHRIIIGTSKTVDSPEYFCFGKNISRFWGSLSSVNNNFNSKQPNTELLKNHGVLITDISNEKGGIEKKDSQIKIKSLKNGFDDLRKIIEEERDLKKIALIGKLATKWFFMYFLDSIILNDDESKRMKTELFSQYGKQNWQLKKNNRSIDCYMLTNTNRNWKSEIWKNFWKDIFSEGDKKTTKR